MKSPLLVFLLLAVDLHTGTVIAGERSANTVESEIQAFREDLERQSLKLDSDAEIEIKQFITQTKYSVNTNDEAKRAHRSVEEFFGGLILKVKETKEASVTTKVVDWVKMKLCPGLWPFC